MSTTWRYIAAMDTHDGEVSWSIRELYTDDEDGSVSWTAEPCHPSGDTWMELMEDIILMSKVFSVRQVLDLTTDPPGLRATKGLGKLRG